MPADRLAEDLLRDRIGSFPRWHYEFTIGGVTTPAPAGHLEWHAQRADRISRPLLQSLGGSLAGCRVLDLGCNSGYWSLLAIEAGCEHVVAVDAQPHFIEQAELVFEALDIDKARYSLVTCDVFDLDVGSIGTFDVVFCLGLLYHVSRPVELMEMMSAMCRDILVIDTQITDSPGTVFELYRNGWAVGLPIALRPSREAVVALADACGFTEILRLDSYHNNRRAAFLCSKSTRLVAG